MLADPSDAEREVLGAIRYQPNDVVLHTDRSLLPAAPARLGELELPPAGRARGPDDRDLPHEPPPDARRRPRVLRDAQPLRRRGPGHGDPQPALRPPGLHVRGARRPGALGRGERAAAAPTTAAPTGATASTRTAWSRRCGCASASERCSHERKCAVRGLDPPPPPRAGGPRVPLPDLPQLPRPGRAARGARPRPALVGPPARRRPGSGGSDFMGDRRGAAPAGGARRRGGADGPAARRARCGCSRACAPSGTCSTRSASTTASTAAGEQVEALAAEVTNTPWGERHVYACDGLRRTLREALPRVALPWHGRRLPAARKRAGRAPPGARGQHGARARASSTPRSRSSAASSAPGAALPLPAPVGARGGRHLRPGRPPEAEGSPLPPPPGAMIARAAHRRGARPHARRAARGGGGRAHGARSARPATSLEGDDPGALAPLLDGAAARQRRAGPVLRGRRVGSCDDLVSLVRIGAREMPRLDRLRRPFVPAAQRASRRIPLNTRSARARARGRPLRPRQRPVRALPRRRP